MVDTDAVPERSLGDDYRIEVFEQCESVTDDDVLALWASERAVPPTEALRRVAEVHLVAMHSRDGLVAVSTAYLQWNEQLRMDMWYYRAFTASSHRSSNLAALIAERGFDELDDRFTSGRDQRSVGVVIEVENPGLKQYFPQAVWMPGIVYFIGENERGDHVRVRYFAGATVPLPGPVGRGV